MPIVEKLCALKEKVQKQITANQQKSKQGEYRWLFFGQVTSEDVVIRGRLNSLLERTRLEIIKMAGVFTNDLEGCAQLRRHIQQVNFDLIQELRQGVSISPGKSIALPADSSSLKVLKEVSNELAMIEKTLQPAAELYTSPSSLAS